MVAFLLAFEELLAIVAMPFKIAIAKPNRDYALAKRENDQ